MKKLLYILCIIVDKKITTKMATKLIERVSTFCREFLINLADKDLLEWHGTSQNDRTQYYTLKF